MRPRSSIGFGENIYKPKNADKTSFYTTIEARATLAPTSKSPEEREFVVDSGALVHMLRKKKGSDELDTLRQNTTTVVTANGEVQTNEEAQVFVHDLDLFVTVQLLEETLAVLSFGKLCEDNGYSYKWVSGQKPRLTKEVKISICKTDNFVPLVVFRVIHQFWKHFVVYIATKRLVERGSGNVLWKQLAIRFKFIFKSSFRGEVTEWHPETGAIPQNPRKNRRNSDDPLADLPEWSEEFTDNLEDTVLRTQIRNVPRKYQQNQGSTVFIGTLPKDRHCEICQRTKITRAPCRKRTGGALRRAEKSGDLITADHKVLNEGCESRNNHPYAVVV